MPATAPDIAAAIRRAALQPWTNAPMKARYPNARDGAVEPAEGFFDNAADGLAAVTARGALFGVERRRFTVAVQDLLWPSPELSIPVVQLVDAEQAMNGKTIAARIELDLGAETTSCEVFG